MGKGSSGKSTKDQAPEKLQTSGTKEMANFRFQISDFTAEARRARSGKAPAKEDKRWRLAGRFFANVRSEESGRGQPHSKTSRRHPGCVARASVLECGCPLPLSLEPPSADRTLQSHPACTLELRFETFGNFLTACEQFGVLQCREGAHFKIHSKGRKQIRIQ